MKYAIVVFSNQEPTAETVPELFPALQSAMESFFQGDVSRFNAEAKFYWYTQQSDQAKKAGIIRFPAVCIGYTAKDGMIYCKSIYDKNNISSNAIVSTMQGINAGLIQEAGGGWTPAPGYQGGTPIGYFGLISPDVDLNIGTALKNILLLLLLAMAGIYIVDQDRN